MKFNTCLNMNPSALCFSVGLVFGGRSGDLIWASLMTVFTDQPHLLRYFVNKYAKYSGSKLKNHFVMAALNKRPHPEI